MCNTGCMCLKKKKKNRRDEKCIFFMEQNNATGKEQEENGEGRTVMQKKAEWSKHQGCKERRKKKILHPYFFSCFVCACDSP